MENFARLLQLIDHKKYTDVRELVQEINLVDLADFIGEMHEDKRTVILFRILPKEIAAEVFSYLGKDLKQKIVEIISDNELTEIISEMFLDDTIDFIEEMPASIVKRVIKSADSATRKGINQLLKFPEDSAGSIMTIEFMELDDDWTVKKAIEEVRKKSSEKESISKLFVTKRNKILEGTIELKNVLAGKDDELIGDIMDTDIISVNVHEDQKQVADMFKKYDFESMPVVDNENRLVGLITIDDIVDVIEEETTEDIYKMAAMVPNEETYLNTSVFMLARKRVLWLMILMVSAFLTRMIISSYDEMLASFVFLSSFIPMLMNTAGNAGSQASVSIIRSIVLNEVKFKDILKVMWKEQQVGILIGAAVALLNFVGIIGINLIFPGLNHPYLTAIVVSLTLFVTIALAKIIGCSLPLIATKFKLDPALMASPMITTIVDAIALVIYFKLATMFFPL